MWDVALARSLKSFVFDYGFFLILFGAALLLFRGRRAAFFKPVVCVIWVLLSVYCSAWFVSFLSAPFELSAKTLVANSEQSNCLETFSTVVVLGGGIESETTPSFATYERVAFAVRFLKSRPQGERKFVVFTGGPTTIATPEADVMLNLFQQLGGAEQAVTERERESLNTYGNAVLVKETLALANKRPRVILITHAFHMPRAFATFTTQGFQVCALAVPLPPAVPRSVFSFSNAGSAYGFVNEAFGFLGYGVKGWISYDAFRQVF